MTPKELAAALRALGWSKAELARRLGMHPVSVSRWRAGVPGYVAAYVRLALACKRLADEIVPAFPTGGQ